MLMGPYVTGNLGGIIHCPNNSQKGINKLYDEGNTIKYFTARGMGRFKGRADKAIETFHAITESQLDRWGCKYHQLILGKPNGDVYIDDKGINDNDFFGD